jgi:hypothetical protein
VVRDRPSPSGPRLQGPIRSDAAPKPVGGGVRSLVRLAPADERGYAAPLHRVASSLAAALGPQVHANRIVGWSGGLPVLEPWRDARRRWVADVRRLALGARVVVTADVRDCYPSIRPGPLRQRLQALDAPAEAIDEVEAWLRIFADHDIRGLPVGPATSAVLAEAVLAAGDQALRSAGVPYVRWVDDVAIFAAHRCQAVAALDILLEAWGDLGLAPDETKTGLHTDPTAWFVEAGARTSLADRRTLR